MALNRKIKHWPFQTGDSTGISRPTINFSLSLTTFYSEDPLPDRKHDVILTRLRIGHTWLTRPYLLLGKSSPISSLQRSIDGMPYSCIFLQFQILYEEHFNSTSLLRHFTPFLSFISVFAHCALQGTLGHKTQNIYLSNMCSY